VKCAHASPQWTLVGCNEDGWKCGDCDASLGDDGFSPQHDRSDTAEKVGAVLLFMHQFDFMYVSNNTMGDGMTADVVRRCHAENTFDQLSIIKWLIDASSSTHTAFWREQAKQAMCSHPSRTPTGNKLVCNACQHGLEIKTSSGPLFSEEPF
jgi:hypothetical protein